MTDTETRERILAYLASHNTLTLATEREAEPHAASLFFANEGFTLYFVSDPKTRHADNLSFNARVSATISEDYRDWRIIQGVQLKGICIQITNPIESAQALKAYTSKFPFVRDLMSAPKELGAAMAKVKFYKITVTWARWIDNTRGLGYKEEIELEE